jgi:hypothetical protein
MEVDEHRSGTLFTALGAGETLLIQSVAHSFALRRGGGGTTNLSLIATNSSGCEIREV